MNSLAFPTQLYVDIMKNGQARINPMLATQEIQNAECLSIKSINYEFLSISDSIVSRCNEVEPPVMEPL